MPAVALYVRREDGRHHAFSLDVLQIEDGAIAEITTFDLSLYHDAFGLPAVLS